MEEIDSEDEFDDGSTNNHENRQKLQAPDQSIYGKDKFIINFNVEFIASLGILQSLESIVRFGKKRHKSRLNNSTIK